MTMLGSLVRAGFIGVVLLSAACVEEAVDPPHYGAFMGVMLVGETEGRMLHGPEPKLEFPPQTPQCIMEAAGNMMQQMMGRAFYTRPFFIGPDLAPDYIDQGVPPFCMAFKWAADQGAPDMHAVDAGGVSFRMTGNGELIDGIDWLMWGLTAPKYTEPTLPESPLGDTGKLTVETQCGRGDHPSIDGKKLYGCPFYPIVALDKSAITDDTSVTISASGGENIGAFSVPDIKAPAALEPTSDFDMNQVDPNAPITAAWKSTTSDWVMTEIFAQTVDPATMPDLMAVVTQGPESQIDQRGPGKQFAQVLCLTPASAGQKAIPDGARAQLPKPEGQDVLVMMTSVIGLSLEQSNEGWGSYMVGAGRGTFGISCWTSENEQCPQPDFADPALMEFLQSNCPRQ